MSKISYPARWSQLEKGQLQHHGISEEESPNRERYHDALRQTFRDFLVACYCDHWKEQYVGAGFDLTTDREVLVARTMLRYGWTPSVTTDMYDNDLALALIDELAVFRLPAAAVKVAQNKLMDLPESVSTALLEPHEGITARL